ncbi:FHA domain-containing protein [Ruminococcus sp.]|uniref:FHA domain-containing protein n=1 Tax=Ruminococcus sp. TaxID=41978 RepID=UPI001B1B8DB7|nr:FHA domain-containing protein [Ruminococcus sp.]MBO5559096.1 FHA domain-containing protein [Ruminococcus sp.]
MNLNQTIYYKPRIKKPATLFILDKYRRPNMITLQGDMTLGKQYPGSDRDIRIDSEIVSRIHGEFIFDDSDGSYYYIDNNSYNGTFINGEKLAKYNERGSKAYKLSDGDIIRIDRDNLNDPHPEAVLIVFSTTFNGSEKWKYFDLSKPGKITIGREQGCELRLSDLMASRSHAILQFQKNEWYIKDNNSTNGIGLNGREMNKASLLHPNDVIRIANTTLIYNGSGILYNSPNETQASLVVDIKDKTVSGGRLLLKDINAQFSNGDFVLILGGSGAGKTTLIKAILGESRANGKIILNGQDLYQNFKSMKSQIGMVPQFLTLRTNDTVRNTLIDTASIKLGRKYSKTERLDRVEQVLEHVGIKEHADKFIGQLSGGQQKKVSVANQLIGFQKVFICDEPDSGLDAASRMQQMEILKEISQEGKIVMVISHEPDDAVEVINGARRLLFTKVIVLARSSKDRAGHLAFFGDIDSAMDFFGVERLQDIMLEINPPTEGGKGKADEYIEKYRRLRGGR